MLPLFYVEAKRHANDPNPEELHMSVALVSSALDKMLIELRGPPDVIVLSSDDEQVQAPPAGKFH